MAKNLDDSNYEELKARVEKITEYIDLKEEESIEAEFLITNLLKQNTQLQNEIKLCVSMMKEKEEQIVKLKAANNETSSTRINQIIERLCKLELEKDSFKTSKEILNKIIDLEESYDECDGLLNTFDKNAITCLTLQDRIKFLISELENKLKKQFKEI